MKKLTTKKLMQYMKNRTDEPLRHDADRLAHACNQAAIEFGHDNALDLLKLVCFNDAIHGLHTHSYSFNTATGRHLINRVKEYYYEQTEY
tara:strand:+ start:11 stop:280 length:270 start_codon:yes stop_codon:yes gene_type:complete